MQKKYLWRWLIVSAVVILGIGLTTQSVFADLGWVGNMVPAGGFTTRINDATPLEFGVEVWKAGVTDSPGQGAGITCTLHLATVPYWDGTWVDIQDIPMTYASDSGNNDRYTYTTALAVGLYEFTAFCTDGVEAWQGAGDGRLAVTSTAGDCSTAQTGDNNLYWSGFKHDTFDVAYRDPIGPLPDDAGNLTLQFRTCMEDVSAPPTLYLHNKRTSTNTSIPMTFAEHTAEGSLGPVTYWTYTLPIPADETNLYYYYFDIQDGTNTSYYGDDNAAFYGGGYGAGYNNPSSAQNSSFQITVYDAEMSVPDWMQQGIVYQIFPDRFRDGDAGNNIGNGEYNYGNPTATVYRSQSGSNNTNGDWNSVLCDPRGTYSPSCANVYGENYYGGDLAGITEKINAGYFDALGISVLYLNPIFEAPSNHGYDTANFMKIDPRLGTLADFQALVAAAEAHNMRIMLDGVFNHTSSDSVYFDMFRRYDASGALVSPDAPGTNDQSGACESAASAFRDWFYIPDVGMPSNSPLDLCNADADADDPSTWTSTYETWWGYGSLPKLKATLPAVTDFFWDNGLSSVAPYWVSQGANAWRFDVGADIDPGLHDPANLYYEGLRAAVNNAAITGKDDVVLLGEEWGDASFWLLGDEWDSVMNYRYRSALLGWLFTGCTGNGCTAGSVFVDNDSNYGSSSGEISYLSPSLLNARLLSIWEDYPPEARKAMMNLAGSHDTNRILFLLKQINNGNEAAAIQRLKEFYLLTFTYEGAPTIYYGDEIAASADGIWSSDNKYEDDPYNRLPFPWDDEAGSDYDNSDTTLTHLIIRHFASIRNSYAALQTGETKLGIHINDAEKTYGFARYTGTQTAFVLLNRDSTTHSITLDGLNDAPYALADGTVLVDILNASTTDIIVSGGAVTVDVNPTWGVILVEKNKIDMPAAPVVSFSVNAAGTTLTWNPVLTDSLGGQETPIEYLVYRSQDPDFTPDNATNLIGGTEIGKFGNVDGKLTFLDSDVFPDDHYYIVCAVNMGLVKGCTSAFTSGAADAAPQVTATTPTEGGTVATSGVMTVTFSEAVDFATDWFTLDCSSSGTVAAAVSGSNPTFTLTPSTDLAAGETCTLTIHAELVTDADYLDPEDAMLADFTLNFNVDDHPAVNSTTPADLAVDVAIDSVIEITFSEDVTLSEGWFTITCTDSGAISATVSGSGSSYTLTPAAAFAPGETCTVTIVATNVVDVDVYDPPQTMSQDYQWSFTTLVYKVFLPIIFR